MIPAKRCAKAIACAAFIVLSGCSNLKVQVDVFPIVGMGPIQEKELASLEEMKRQEIVLTALTTLGQPYVWGGKDPKTGFDCSGLVYFAYTESGFEETEMPRVTTELAKESRPIKKSELKAGDLVFFNTLGRRYSHVGLYIGDGRFINAPSKGKRVRIDSMESPYYKKRFTGARRLQVLEDVTVAESKSSHTSDSRG